MCLPSVFSLVLYKGTELTVAKWWEQVYGWGRGEHGRLGFGDDKSSKMIPQKVHTLESEFIVQVCILNTFIGYVWCWIWYVGKTNYTSRFIRTKQTLLRFQNHNTIWCPVFWQVACGGTHSVALTNDGRIFSVSIFTLSQFMVASCHLEFAVGFSPDRCFCCYLKFFNLPSSILDVSRRHKHILHVISQTLCLFVCLSVCLHAVWARWSRPSRIWQSVHDRPPFGSASVSATSKGKGH